MQQARDNSHENSAIDMVTPVGDGFSLNSPTSSMHVINGNPYRRVIVSKDKKTSMDLHSPAQVDTVDPLISPGPSRESPLDKVNTR